MHRIYRLVIFIAAIVYVMQLNGQVVDVRKLPSSVLFAGNDVTAYKAPMGDFDKNASIGLAWSRDLVKWEWKK